MASRPVEGEQSATAEPLQNRPRRHAPDCGKVFVKLVHVIESDRGAVHVLYVHVGARSACGSWPKNSVRQIHGFPLAGDFGTTSKQLRPSILKSRRSNPSQLVILTGFSSPAPVLANIDIHTATTRNAGMAISRSVFMASP
jgi:hypothetical protein